MEHSKPLIALIVTFATGVQNVLSYDLEHNRTMLNISKDTTFDNGILNNTLTQCEEIIGLILPPIYSSGMCLSIIVCFLAFVIYASIHKKVFKSSTTRDQDNTKHWIHFNFIISFILRDVAILIALFSPRFNQEVKINLAASTFYIYTLIANFYWMFIEGLWLYVGVFFAISFKQWRHTKIKACIIGWIVPGVFMMIWAIAEYILSQHDVRKTWLYKGFWGPSSISCILVPVYFIITVNSMMMIRVLHKVRKMQRNELGMKRRLARATFVLSFLLGLNFAIPLIIYSLHLPLILNNQCAIKIINFINSVVSSLQGLFVAVFYVLSNKDVLQFLRTQINEDLPNLPDLPTLTPMPSPRPSRSSRTSQTSPACSRRDRSLRLSGSSRTSQSSSMLSPSSAEQSRQTSMTSQGSSLTIPSITSYRSSQDSRTSQGSSLLNVPHVRVSRLSETSETSETSITLHVPLPQTRSNSEGYQFLSRHDDNDSVFV